MLTVGQLRKKLRRKERIRGFVSLLASLALYGFCCKGVLFAWSAFKGNAPTWGFLFYGMILVILGLGLLDDVVRDLKRIHKPDYRRQI
jgi:Kef-type K+ transport system membrane component KefB